MCRAEKERVRSSGSCWIISLFPTFRCCTMLLPHSPASQMSQVCTQWRRNLSYGSQQPEVQRCGKEPTQQLCFPSRSLKGPGPFCQPHVLAWPSPGLTAISEPGSHQAKQDTFSTLAAFSLSSWLNPAPSRLERTQAWAALGDLNLLLAVTNRL